MLHQHANGSAQSANLREMSPHRNRGHNHMQSLETGGIHHSGDEQGRAPLESVHSSVHNPTTRQHSAGRNDMNEDNGTTNIVTNAPAMAGSPDTKSNQE